MTMNDKATRRMSEMRVGVKRVTERCMIYKQSCDGGEDADV